MLRFTIRRMLLVVAACGIGFTMFPWPQRVKTRDYEDLSRHPQVVQHVIDSLKEVPGGCSLAEFESAHLRSA